MIQGWGRGKTFHSVPFCAFYFVLCKGVMYSKNYIVKKLRAFLLSWQILLIDI